MEVNKGPIRHRPTVGTWTCKLSYSKQFGVTVYSHIHAKTREECKAKIEQEINRIKSEV